MRLRLPLHLPPFRLDEPLATTRKRAGFRTAMAQLMGGRGFMQFTNRRASVMPKQERRFKRQWPGDKRSGNVGAKAGVRREG